MREKVDKRIRKTKKKKNRNKNSAIVYSYLGLIFGTQIIFLIFNDCCTSIDYAINICKLPKDHKEIVKLIQQKSCYITHENQ